MVPVSAEFVLHTPGPAVRGAVLRYAGFAERTQEPVRSRELPGTFVPIILDLDAGWRISDGRRPGEVEHLRSFVGGLTDGPVLVEHPGSARCLQIDLAPLAARRLLGVPMSELANRCVPMEDVWGRAAHELVERLADARSWHDRFALIEHTLAARLADSAPVDPGITWSMNRLETSGGTAVIGDLARELGWSHRRLIARFRDAIGLPPKRVARIQRFERLAAVVERDPALGWAAAAAVCGYADQAHLVREVRDLTGLTPTELLRVNFLQDDAVAGA